MRTNNIRLGYTLEFPRSFHCGTGLRTGLIQRSVARDHEGYVYVPGSSLKGVLRERATHLAHVLNLDVPPTHSQQNLDEFAPVGDIVSHIFGSRFRPGTLFFDDAPLCDKDREFYEERMQHQHITTRTRVSLSPHTRTARQGLLFGGEYSIPGLRFTGQIYGQITGVPLVDEPSLSYPLLLFLAALCSLDRVGGGTSAGMGQVTCHVTLLSIDGHRQQQDAPSREQRDTDPSDAQNTDLLQPYLEWLPGFEFYALALEELDNPPEAAGETS